MKWIQDKSVFLINVLLAGIFLPVLCCVVFIGNRMDYFTGMKIETLLPNQVLFVAALIEIGVCIFLLWGCRKLRLTFKVNFIINVILVAMFIGLYMINVRVAREIAFKLPWDIKIIRGVSYKIAEEEMLGYYYYLSIYSNNIPIAYILGKIFKFALDEGADPHLAEFMWLKVNCGLISIGGYFSCLLVKKLTQKLMPVVVAFFLYLTLVGISPWKIAPYTDTYGIVFPVMCIYFYFCYRDAEKPFLRYLCIGVALMCGMIGGFMKPSIYIIILAVLGIEVIGLFADWGVKWRYVLVEVLLTLALFFAGKVCQEHIIEAIGLDFNGEIEAGWQHYFLMGLNENTTGGYNSDDIAMFGEFQTSRKDRTKAELERAMIRLKERGFFGSIYFWLRKMVMTFNDGTFGWSSEVWIHEQYEPELAGNTGLTQRLRGIFWPDAPNMRGYNTLCQLEWIFCILGIPGICIRRDGKYAVLAVGFLGIFFYQMLFEARARYLFVFMPLLTVVSICGICQYAFWITDFLLKRKKYTGRKPDELFESGEE